MLGLAASDLRRRREGEEAVGGLNRWLRKAVVMLDLIANG